MPKYPVPGAEVVVPQLRPRFEVEMDPRGEWHRHEQAYAGNPGDLARHLEEDHADSPVDLDVRHRHDAMAKYLLPPREKEAVPHDHRSDPAFAGPAGRARLRAHLTAAHRDRRSGTIVAPPRSLSHEHRRPKRGQHVADRLDMHPWALARIPSAERLYFALEGAVKADAILTRIIETGAQASVFDVPSVTLWKAPELRRFASSYLKGKQVVIVPDADWRRNSRVGTQALLCREYLRALGVDACVAAPPVRDKDARECKCGWESWFDGVDSCAMCDGYLKGVDDFLAAGGDLDELRVLDREASFRLALFADRNGRIGAKSIRALARYLRVRRDAIRVRDVLEKYVRDGWLTADRELVVEQNEWTNRLEWRGRRVSEWPKLTIRPDLRYHEREVLLRDHAPRPRDLLAERGINQRDLAIITDLIEGATLEEATEGWYDNPETGRRRTPAMRWVTAMRKIMLEVYILELAAAGRTRDEIVEEAETSRVTVKRVLTSRTVNPRWLAALNDRARAEVEATIAEIICGSRGRIEAPFPDEKAGHARPAANPSPSPNGEGELSKR